MSVPQLPFGKRRPVGGSMTLAIRALHSSVISISGIVSMEMKPQRGRVSPNPTDFAS